MNIIKQMVIFATLVVSSNLFCSFIGDVVTAPVRAAGEVATGATEFAGDVLTGNRTYNVPSERNVYVDDVTTTTIADVDNDLVDQDIADDFSDSTMLVTE